MINTPDPFGEPSLRGIDETLLSLESAALSGAMEDTIVMWHFGSGPEALTRLLHTMPAPAWIPNAEEYVMHPRVTVEERIRGDADDMAVCLAALLLARGYECRFVAQGYDSRSGYQHVVVHARVNGEWVSCDPTTGESGSPGTHANDHRVTLTRLGNILKT